MPVGRGELGAERHAAGPAQAAAAGAHDRAGQRPRDLHQPRRRIADRLVEDDVSASSTLPSSATDNAD